MKKLIIALLALAMMACHQPETTSLKVVEVDVNSADYRKEEAAFKHFDFVKLDTVSDALLSDVSKVLVGEDRLYVLPMMDPRVFIFDGEGKYIHSLKRGQGPGEIRFVYDMDLHDGNLMCMTITAPSASMTRTETFWRMSIRRMPITC